MLVADSPTVCFPARTVAPPSNMEVHRSCGEAHRVAECPLRSVNSLCHLSFCDLDGGQQDVAELTVPLVAVAPVRAHAERAHTNHLAPSTDPSKANEQHQQILLNG